MFLTWKQTTAKKRTQKRESSRLFPLFSSSLVHFSYSPILLRESCLSLQRHLDYVKEIKHIIIINIIDTDNNTVLFLTLKFKTLYHCLSIEVRSRLIPSLAKRWRKKLCTGIYNLSCRYLVFSNTKILFSVSILNTLHLIFG